MKLYLFIMSLFFCSIINAQNIVTGSVTDSNKQPIPGANIRVAGESEGTTTDSDGNFKLNTAAKLPFSIEVSSVGYGVKKLKITSENQKVAIVLTDEETKLDEIVVSASRTPERVRESPVTIERMTIKDIKKTASPTFYDGLENLKEVHMNTSSMSFKSINTRGFATVANNRFLQLVDGMDNSSPLLNFVLGNLIGVSEIDVQNVELLPGASSALYGANAFNGILFMNSKSPFTYQGVSAYVKYGSTSQNAAGTNEYYDYGVRVAKAFSPYLAAKANFTFLKGTDWFSTNYNEYRNGLETGNTREFYGYDGLNVYGDEAALNLKSRQAFGSAPYNILPNDVITRTGYNETDLTENKVRNAKVDFSIHFKPFAKSANYSDIELIAQSKFGFGNSIYQGASRYNLNNFFIQQHKLELKGKNFFIRGYTTTEDGGKSYDMTFTALNINRAWKSDQAWFQQYGAAYILSTLAGQAPSGAHAIARNFADYNITPDPSTGINLPSVAALGGGQPRFMPGTPEFKNAFNKVVSDPDVLTGSKLVDNSQIYHSDVNYNFKDIFKPAEIQVGGSYRLYDLNSHGRIYTDDLSHITYNEYGIYTQVQKKLMEDRLKLTGSVRYDKSKNFDGNFSPRVSFVYAVDQQKNHNIRGSFQTGFRNPTTQDQYIGFDIGSRVLIGSAEDNLLRFNEVRGENINGSGLISDYGVGVLGATTKTLNGEDAYYNSFTEESYLLFDSAYRSGPPSGLANAAKLLVKANVALVKPEEVKAFDLGYRGTAKGFSWDVNGYYNIYNNFIGNYNVVTPYYGTAVTNPDTTTNTSANALANRDSRVYQIYTNTDVEITSLGFGVGVSKKIIKNFELSANYNYAEFSFDKEKDPSFEASFNTPKHRVKASISNDNLFKNFGFNISGRWNQEYLWESTFADGMIDAATVLDAQINYNIPSLKSILKVGATNIGSKEYYQVLGAGAIGQQYFVSLTINP
ncbi:TonB-dependent receptor domain-containing protein [Flavobacterium sp.]|uniref:TonB-dependent receptor domain-containing protein n=1 Tax=Flavobacterium sp. TaxID=239 RepID=UPI00286D5F7B|nr:TonB-dependent receptor [Flavobacterium sp.]